jgi:hypothetical protein
MLSSLPVFWLVVVIVVLAVITSAGLLEIPANLLLGASVLLLAYQYKDFRQLYDSGW